MRIGDIELTEPAEWNRETIADGNWLQTNTMRPLWENEIALARAIGENKTKSAINRIIPCKISYETSPYDVDEGKQLAYLKEINDELAGDQLYITAEKCYKWMNEDGKILVILGDSESQNYTYFLSSYWNQGTDAENRRKYRMTFVCNSAGDATKRRLVSTFLSENINSSYSTTKMRMYNVSNPQGIHWCIPSYEVQDLVTEDQVVRVDYNQSSILTDAQKETARNNIEASQVKWVNAIDGAHSTTRIGNLAIVQMQSGRYINDESGNVAALAPVPAANNQDKGKVFTVDPTTGYLTWRPIPKVNPDVGKFVKLQQHKLVNHQGNNVYISNGYNGASVELNAIDGRYPSKVIGTMQVACVSTGNTEPSMSVCVTKTFHQLNDTNWDPEDNSNNVNYDILLGGSFYNNNLTFMFTSETCPTFKYTGIKYLTFKGRSDCTYNIKSLQLQCFYEKLPDPPPSNDSASVSENDSEND